MANTVSVTKGVYGTPPGILQFPDGCEGYAHTFDMDDSAAAAVNGRKIVRAGTIYPKNDATATGVVLYDCDVTDGTATGTVLYKAAVNVNRIPQAPTDDALRVLTQIAFYTADGRMVPKYAAPAAGN